MATKTKAASPGRRSEIAGICLLGTGIFCAISLVSMQSGSTRMMGPGGAAAAAGLYSVAGLGAYLLVACMLVVAWRCFGGPLLRRGATEVVGILGLICASTVLLHLPFAHDSVLLHGPGGLLGQWLGQVTASFVGGVGAALAATMVLAISLILLTDVRIAEVVAVLGWAGKHIVQGLAAGAAALGRVVVAMFPEKDERQALDRAGDPQDGDAEDLFADEASVDERAAPPPLEDRKDGESQAVIVGRPREEATLSVGKESRRRPAPAETLDFEEEERRAVAAMVAEVAAADGSAEALAADVSAEDPSFGEGEPARALCAEGLAAASDTQAEDVPIIVEPAFRPRQRALEPEPVRPDAGPGFIQLSDGAFALPSSELLEYQAPQGAQTDKQALIEMAERLEQAMVNYGVRGKVKEIHMGPVVTMFEFVPAPGTRTGKIAQLENDLAMALEAQAVRIVAPIPGKAAVGVEVPNRHRETVYLKEILMDGSFQHTRAKLQVGLGKDIKGAPVSVNLAKMPHLLVAGTTGSGKSVAVNSMITSILFNATPEEARFIMVDPKMLELSIYEGIPHLLLPVVTDPKKANLALRWAVEEMERRYEILASSGVRDISSYNARIEAEQARAGVPVTEALAETPSKRARRLKVLVTGEDGIEREVEVDAESASAPIPEAALADADEESARSAAVQAAAESAEPRPRKLPYIVIVIDEFADLMMVAPKDVETSVARLAQKARAAGLHLILATQRPSVDVITGLIKANFPSRIALQVASKIDSRTILDQPGAETLLGNGDMLFSDRGTKLRRIHGAFLSDEEVHRVVDFLKTQAKPVYDMEILKPRDEEGEEGGAPVDDFHDDLYDKAVAIVCETRQASVSYIQRRLQIGYNRSARMVEQMERDGIVGPANGIKAREVLAPAGEYLTAAS